MGETLQIAAFLECIYLRQNMLLNSSILLHDIIGDSFKRGLSLLDKLIEGQYFSELSVFLL